MAHLRTARQMRQAKGGNTKSGLGQIVDTVSIRERPVEAKDRAVPGHWEARCFSPGRTTRTSRRSSSAIPAFVMLLKIPEQGTLGNRGRRAHETRCANCRSSRAAALTWDRAARRWPTIQEPSPSLPTCRFHFCVIHTAPGSGGSKRAGTPTVCCDSISRAEQISPRMLLARLPKQNRAAAQSTPPQDLGVRNPCR